ncbi:PEP-CTERM sorting domain-containing protein [Pseudoduganella plicata]|uniref:PEP-CTERM sorting domain-containing protein n=1 Tax=Pseudoduganella plicata TaxID=321984 RepID=A0ABX5SGF7_9BURK|nr:PEP-CTERM sorting domain-containing protein [Pseudoduganella plicata]
MTSYSHSYVNASAVPEPGTYLMFGAGLLLLAGSCLRRTRQTGT